VYIGVCRLSFHLPGNDSLKGKRHVSRSLIERLRQRFNLAVAEVDALDRHQTLVIGLTCISNEAAHVSETIDNALRFVQGQHVDAELIDVQREIINGV
jgi:uncharacterized protein YlxP (DUF503 family)